MSDKCVVCGEVFSDAKKGFSYSHKYFGLDLCRDCYHTPNIQNAIEEGCKQGAKQELIEHIKWLEYYWGVEPDITVLDNRRKELQKRLSVLEQNEGEKK